MSYQTREARIILAVEKIRTSKKISHRAAAKIYNIPEAILRDRMNGKSPRIDQRSPLQKLTELEEGVNVQYTLNLDSRGFPPRIEDVQELLSELSYANEDDSTLIDVVN